MLQQLDPDTLTTLTALLALEVPLYLLTRTLLTRHHDPNQPPTPPTTTQPAPRPRVTCRLWVFTRAWGVPSGSFTR